MLRGFNPIVNEVIIMRKIEFKNKFFAKVLSLLIIASLIFPGTVYSQGSVKLIESGQNIGPGTYYRNMNYITPNGNFMVNMVECRIDAEYLKVEAADGGSSIVNKPVSYQALQKSDENRRVIGAINGDFFDMTTIKGLTYGTSIIEGEIKTAVKSSTVLGIRDDGDCFIDTLNMNGTFIYKNRKIPIDTVNRLRWGEQAVIYTPFFGKTTLNTVSSTNIVVKGVELPLKANQTYSGVIEKIVPDTMNTFSRASFLIIPISASSITSAVAGYSILLKSVTSAKICPSFSICNICSRPSLESFDILTRPDFT